MIEGYILVEDNDEMFDRRGRRIVIASGDFDSRIARSKHGKKYCRAKK
jgi:hypothetical protein